MFKNKSVSAVLSLFYRGALYIKWLKTLLTVHTSYLITVSTCKFIDIMINDIEQIFITQKECENDFVKAM